MPRRGGGGQPRRLAAGAAPGAVGAPGAEAGWLTLELRKRP